MKKVLIITYHFPPDAAVGAIRPAKFAKYLPEFGWQPFILTVKDKYYDKKDESKVADLDNKLKIIRTYKLANVRDIYLKLKKNLAKIRGGKKKYLKDMLSYQVVSQSENNGKGFRSTIRRIIFSLFAWLPDDKLGWVPLAVMNGLRIIKKENVNMILTTSPPHSVHLVGLFLKAMTGIKWSADFRDPWMIDFKKRKFVRTKLSDKIETYMEKKVVEKSDLIISTNERATDKFISYYPDIDTDKFITISNGFDEEDFYKLRNTNKYPVFTISYMGTFYHGRTPELLLKAISELISERKINDRDFLIQFIGSTRYINGQSVEKMIQDFNLSDSVKVTAWMPYGDALIEMAKSHVLLLLAHKQPLQVPGKVFEYIGLRSNILAILDDGATSDLLKNYGRAIIIRENDIHLLKKAIMDFYHNCADVPDKELRTIVNSYERRFLTKRLAEVLSSTYVTK